MSMEDYLNIDPQSPVWESEFTEDDLQDLIDNEAEWLYEVNKSEK